MSVYKTPLIDTEWDNFVYFTAPWIAAAARLRLYIPGSLPVYQPKLLERAGGNLALWS